MECTVLVPNFQTGSQKMFSTVSLLSTTSRSSALSSVRWPISFGIAVFKLGAKTSDGHQCRAPSLKATFKDHRKTLTSKLRQGCIIFGNRKTTFSF